MFGTLKTDSSFPGKGCRSLWDTSENSWNIREALGSVSSRCKQKGLENVQPSWPKGSKGSTLFIWSIKSPQRSLLSAAAAKSLQSCPTLCDPMDCRLPGSSIHGIFWATVLEWGAIAFSPLLSGQVQKTTEFYQSFKKVPEDSQLEWQQSLVSQIAHLWALPSLLFLQVDQG